MAALGGTTFAVFTVRLANETPSPGTTDVVDPSVIVRGLDANFWIVLGLAFAFGALGGLIYELINLRGTVEWPHRSVQGEDPLPLPYAIAGNLFDLGFIARMTIGAAAAVAVTLFIAPSNILRLVATAVITGSAGSSVFGALQDRILSQLKQKENANLRAMNLHVRSLMEQALKGWPVGVASDDNRQALVDAIAVSRAADDVT